MASLIVTSVTVFEPDAEEDPRVLAWVSVCVADAVKVRGAKLVRGKDMRIRLFWPTRHDRTGQERPTTHAVSRAVHIGLENQVLEAYELHSRSRHEPHSMHFYERSEAGPYERKEI